MTTFPLKPRKKLLETLALHGIYNLLGFDAKDIFLCVHGNKFQVLLKHGDLEFAVDMGRVKNMEQFLDSWPKAVNYWNNANDAIRDNIVDTSDVRSLAVSLIMGLVSKGFTFPNNHEQERWN